MNELNLITDMVEEQIAKGNLRWLANFKEIRRNFELEDLTVPLYASGGLEEKGFILSRLFSSFITPKYKVHLVIQTSQEFDEASLKKLINACKREFSGNDWIFIGLVQNRPIGKQVKSMIENLGDPRVGAVVYSLAAKERISSQNVLGKGLAKQLKLAEPRFEALDMPDYLKGFAIVFCLSTLAVISFQLLFGIRAFNFPYLPLTFLFLFGFSIIAGYQVYKHNYHSALVMTSKGFELRKGNSVSKRNWAEFKDATIYITPKYETCIRLYGENGTFDLPLSRIDLSRKDAYAIIKQAIEKK